MGSGADARCCMPGAAHTTCWRSASRRRARTTSSPSTNARFWRPASPARFATAWTIAEILKPANKPLDIQATATDTGLDIDVRGSGTLDTARMTALARVAEAHGSRASRAMANWSRSAHSRWCKSVGRSVPLPPGAFLQATAEGEAALARLVLNYADKADNVADLFAGIGTFALRLAAKARVSAADNDDTMIKALQSAASKSSGLKPIDARARDLFRRPFVTERTKKLRCGRVRSTPPGSRNAGA